MAIVSIVVCDVCEDPSKPTKRWNVSGDEGRVRLTLCDDHAQPLREMLKLREAAKPVRRQPRGPRVTTMEEIEALKRSRKQMGNK